MQARLVSALLAVSAVLATAAQAAALPPGFRATPVLTGLNQPTSVRFAPAGGPVFVAEKRGVIKAFDGLGDTTPTTVIDLRTETMNISDRGLLGLAVDPGWPSRPYVYVLYARDADVVGGPAPRYGTPNTDGDPCPNLSSTGCVVTGRLARVRVDPATDRAVGSPTTLIDGWCQQFSSHSVGDLRFGPDGMLYVSAGEGASWKYADYGQTGNECGDPANEGGALRAQDIRTTGDPLGYSGALIRLSPDGGKPAIVAYGFRNPYRFAVRPGTSELWVGDVGWDLWEELDRIAAPSSASPVNFGWPCYEGAARQPSYDALNKPLCESLYALGSSAWARPYWAYSHLTAVDRCALGAASESGVAFASTGGDYPAAYRGGLFVSDYSRDCIWYLPRGANGLPDAARVSTFAHGGVHPVELEPAPGGDLLYVDINDGSVVRVSYDRPVAVATAAPTSGTAPLTVQLDGTASTGNGLAYAWDLDGDGEFDDATGARPTATFAAGTYALRLQVTDASGVSAVSAPLTVSADVTPAAPSSQASNARPVVARLVRRRHSVIARRDGSVLLRAHCPSATACAGTVAVRAVRGGQALGRARFTVPARRTVTVRVRLTAACRHRLARHAKMRAISIMALVPAAGPTWRTDTVFTLRAPQRAAGAPRDARRRA
jgi:glucose/arabinose dehydrogenase